MEINTPRREDRVPVPTQIANATPTEGHDFIYEPGRGGRRLDTEEMRKRRVRREHVAASHFGEVNTYFHMDRMAAYVDRLLQSLGRPSLPKVVALVNAHSGAIDRGGRRDGVMSGGRWCAFQGGHYRLPSSTILNSEPAVPAENGEVHFGPGRTVSRGGALAEYAGVGYRANASHNAGIIYHEYGHHVVRHTADPMANRLRHPQRQVNRKSALDEGCCDYLAAALLGTPDIWALHHHHSETAFHPRSLRSAVTMGDFDPSASADPHKNGTILGAALWDLRVAMSLHETGAEETCDRTLLEALCLLGESLPSNGSIRLRDVVTARSPFGALLGAWLDADTHLNRSRFGPLAIEVFAHRGIHPPIGVSESRRRAS